jgi:uncharacterized protein (TIGR02246 family)
MPLIRKLALLVLALAPSWVVVAQTTQPAEAIRQVLLKSADDWNRGDLDAFATSYKNSPDILFVGRKVARGYAQMLASYKAGYSTPAKMGQLAFTNLEVQPLDAHFATVTGNFALARTAEGGGNAQGHFLLVMEKTPQGWKIVRDASTADPAPAAANP